MQYAIEKGPVFTILKVFLNYGESFKAEAGAMISMSPSIDLEAKASGKGFFGSIKAAVGGESFFASLYTATRGPGEIIFAPAALGDIICLELRGNTILAEGGAYLAGNQELEISTRGSLRGMTSGEGLFLQVVRGYGLLFLNSYGAIIEKLLAPGESYIVDTGHIVAFDECVQYQLRKAGKSFMSTLGTGEGLVCEYRGPGRIWMQTRNLSALAAIINKFLPQR